VLWSKLIGVVDIKEWKDLCGRRVSIWLEGPVCSGVNGGSSQLEVNCDVPQPVPP
jgi:hypothetical protein